MSVRVSNGMPEIWGSPLDLVLMPCDGLRQLPERIKQIGAGCRQMGTRFR